MPSHLSDIGFIAETEDEFLELHDQARRHGTAHSTPDGTYYRWSSGSGVELWAQVDPGDEGIGLVPHFDGTTRIQLGLASVIRREGDTALDGSLYAWAEPVDGGRDGLFPVVFDQPDHRLSPASFPSIAWVQLAAFAREPLSLFATEADYVAPHPLPPAVESFIPVGTFKENAVAKESPEAIAFFTGRILNAALRRNPHTGRPFYWLRVKTLGGEVDVVADPELVSATPVSGGVVQGTFWLSGRLTG